MRKKLLRTFSLPLLIYVGLMIALQMDPASAMIAALQEELRVARSAARANVGCGETFDLARRTDSNYPSLVRCQLGGNLCDTCSVRKQSTDQANVRVATLQGQLDRAIEASLAREAGPMPAPGVENPEAKGRVKRR